MGWGANLSRTDTCGLSAAEHQSSAKRSVIGRGEYCGARGNEEVALQGQGPFAGGLGTPRNQVGRERDARPDGACGRSTARASRWQGAHIAGCLHMTIQTAVLIETLIGTWGGGHLEQLQYLLDPGSCGGGDRGDRRACLRLERHEQNEEFDWCIEQTLIFPDGKPLDLILDDGGDLTAMVHERFPELLPEHPRAVGRDDHGRPPAVPDARAGRAEGAGHQRQRFGDQEQVRQSLRLPRVAGRRHQACDRRDDRRQGRSRLRLWRRGQGLCPFAATLRSSRDRHRNRSDQCPAGGHGRFPSDDAWTRRHRWAISSSPRPATAM